MQSKISFKNSRLSLKDYFSWRKERGRRAITRIAKYMKLSGARVLDFGCGYGGLSAGLADKGVFVTACDIDAEVLNKARKLVRSKKHCRFIEVKNGRLPFASESFDAVFLLDVIEHVKDPNHVICECKRVLKKGGILYAEFTPYYSFIGHHLWDLTWLPIHLLPKKMVHGFVFRRNELWQVFKSLNKLKINQFQKLTNDLQKLEERFIIKWPDIFEINIPFLKLFGPLQDIFTMSFEGIYVKGS